jgi:hypothetical protein
MSEVESPNVLKETEAKIRCKQVASVSYDLSLQLKCNAQDYNAEVKIEFDFKRVSDADPSLFLDFVGRKIHQIQINGTSIDSINNYWNGKRIYFPNSALQLGRNTISIKYTNDYNHDGQGFHQFVDPEDKQVCPKTEDATLELYVFINFVLSIHRNTCTQILNHLMLTSYYLVSINQISRFFPLYFEYSQLNSKYL